MLVGPGVLRRADRAAVLHQVGLAIPPSNVQLLCDASVSVPPSYAHAQQRAACPDPAVSC